MVARFDAMKDHRTFIRAASLLARQDKRVHFALIGSGMEAGNRVLLSEIPLTLRNRFHLLGQRDDMPRVMNGLDILTSTSFGEGFSNVVGEAMSSGTICVVSDVGDSAFIVGDTGLVVRPAAPVELFEAWKSLLQSDDTDLQKMRDRARDRIIERFAIESIVSRFEDFYQGLFKKKDAMALRR